jgi:NNP family nitrate/nitrite transporter-like MFS transporter
MQEQYGLGIIIAGVAFSLFNWAGVFSNPIGGFASDRRGEKTVIFVSLLVTAVAVLFFIGVKILPVLFLAVFVMGWFINFPRSPLFTIIPKLWGTEMAGKASGVQNMFAAIGGLALPFLMGYIRDATGSYYMGWVVLAAMLFVGTMLNQMVRGS